MIIKQIKLARFFSKHEFTAKYLLCCSDCEGLSLNELLHLTDKDTLKMWEDLHLGYTEALGHSILRDEISMLYKNITPDQVFVAAPEEIIFILMNTLLTPQDHIVVTYPGYQSLFEIAASIGADITPWRPKLTKNGFNFDLGQFENLIKPNTKMIIINFPHNPTGAHISQNTLNNIVKLAKEKNIILFSDEMYRLLEHDKKERLESACDLYENAISLSGMSKSFSLAGLRVGWLATKNKKIYEKACEFKDYTTICNSAPSEILAIMGLRAKNTIIKNNLKLIKTNLDLLDSFFEQYKSTFEWYRPKVGPIAFPRLKLDTAVEKFCRHALDQKGVLLLPSDLYGYKSNNFRIGFGRKTLPQSLNQLEEYIKTL